MFFYQLFNRIKYSHIVAELCFEQKEWAETPIVCSVGSTTSAPVKTSHHLITRHGVCLYVGPQTNQCGLDASLPIRVDRSCCAVALMDKPSCYVTSWPAYIPGCGPPADQRVFYDCNKGKNLYCLLINCREWVVVWHLSVRPSVRSFVNRGTFCNGQTYKPRFIPQNPCIRIACMVPCLELRTRGHSI